MVEIKDPNGTVTKVEADKTFLTFPVEIPGKYQWRVKSYRAGKFSEFSQWASVQVTDAILNFESTLMKSPSDKEVHDVKVKGPFIDFSFSRPVPKWEYTLEIYEDDELEIKKSLNEDTFRYRVSESVEFIKWRVRARNSLGLKTKNKDFWNVSVLPLYGPKPISKWFYDFSISTYFFKQKFAKSNEDSGSTHQVLQGHGIGHRYLARKKIFHSLEGGLYYLLPLGFTDEFSSLNLEVRARFNLFNSLRLMAEYETARISYKFKERGEAIQQTTFVGLGFETVLSPVSNKLTGAFILNQSFQADEFLPSYKLRFNYEYNEDLRINFKFVSNRVKPEIDSNEAKTFINQIELGLSYFL